MKRRSRLLTLSVILFCAVTASRSRTVPARFSESFSPVPGGHGCVNAAGDVRVDPFGIVCSLQRRYSYKSTAEPKLHEQGTWAWGLFPPYLVCNRKLQTGRWRLMRVGWRYDRNWHGYIGPSGAWKTIPQPLLFY
jgi:hypothetical protein